MSSSTEKPSSATPKNLDPAPITCIEQLLETMYYLHADHESVKIIDVRYITHMRTMHYNSSIDHSRTRETTYMLLVDFGREDCSRLLCASNQEAEALLITLDKARRAVLKYLISPHGRDALAVLQDPRRINYTKNT